MDKEKELLLLTDEEIYALNDANTKERKHLLWESGVLDTIKAMIKVQHTKTQAHYEAEIRKLRELLWNHHGCSSQYLYGDDGELQCSNLSHRTLNPFDFMDFRRDSANLLGWKLMNEQGKRIIPRPES